MLFFVKNGKTSNYKQYKSIRQRTTKQTKAEKNCFSLFTDDLSICIICVNCHSIMHKSSELQNVWHIKGQRKFEEVYPDLEFIEIFGRNYK